MRWAATYFSHPSAPIEKGRPGPGLLAQVITAKYADHLPLNRQVDIFARHGVTRARQTLGEWVAKAAAPEYRAAGGRLATIAGAAGAGR